MMILNFYLINSFSKYCSANIKKVAHLFSQILGEPLASQEVHIQQTIVVGKPTGDGGFQM